MNFRKQLKKDADVFEMVLRSKKDDHNFISVSSRTIDSDWRKDRQEGQLAVDVINNNSEIIIVSTMAGADPNQIEVYIHDDLLTIRGNRIMPVAELPEANYLHQECFWGRFSRTIVLPVDVKGDSARAEYKAGVLTIAVPKRKIDSRISVTIVDD